MALITATWKVTIGGATVLLDWPDLMNAEPKWVPAGKVDPVLPLRAAFVSYQPRGLRSNTLMFSRIKTFDSDVDAREWLASHVVGLPLCSGLYPATIELLNGGSLKGNAVLSSAGQPTTQNNWALLDYTLLFGELLYTPAAGQTVPVLGTSANEAIDLGGGVALDVSA